MKTLINDSGGGRFTSTEFEQSSHEGHGRGRGLASVGDALARAGLAESAEPQARQSLGVEARSMADCLASGEIAAGPLLREAQGQADLRLAESCLFRLVARMQGAGRIVERNGHEWRDAIGAGACALAVWRATGADVDGQPETLAARVAWRAVVRELSRDWLGESVSLSSVSDDWLWQNAEQADNSRAELAARLKVERAALGRKALLLRRLDNLPDGRGRRAETICKLQRAATALLDGANLDDAATAAGFKAHGRNKAADHLLTACKRLGIIAPLQTGEGFTVRTRARIVGKTSQVRVPARVGGKEVIITNEARRIAAARRLGLRLAVPVRAGKVWLLPDDSVSFAAPWARA